ncbi:hypothetical protein [Alteromonas stellipolaris]|uniref:hypothetical protein n=1 Tax=Alteromonas stellipolaris TaxID=233316 RepID=UPI001DCC3DE5|nr:hypothetical protein [Alteromonas stellipolaris]MBZ2163215.1 hypothetical protein [Alteromonas stellipolaris]
MNVDDMYVECLVPESYEGRCLVILGAGHEIELVLPTLKDAQSVSNFALNPEVGGFSTARIECTDRAVTLTNSYEWLFDIGITG